jgi:hypothetical protein
VMPVPSETKKTVRLGMKVIAGNGYKLGTS